MRQDCPFSPGSLVWGYCRESGGDEQDIGSQVEAVEAYCTTHSLILVHIFKDEARTGSAVAGRDEFLAMIRAAHCEPRPVDGVVFWAFSRLSRDYDDAQFYKADLRRRGYALTSITEPVPEGPAGRLVEAAIDFANATFLSQMRESVKRGLHNLARQGYAPGGSPPKGYLAEETQIGFKRSGQPRIARKWIPDPELFPLACKAWEMRARGATYTEIQKVTGLYRSASCWSSFFDNKTYLGVRKCGDLEIPDAHPAACTQEQWDKVQAMKKRYRSMGGGYSRRVRSPFLLSGLLECSYCGSAVSGSTANTGPSSGSRQPWRHYICARKKRQGWHTCEGRSLKAERVEQAVIQTVLDDILTLEHFHDLVEQVNRELAADQDDLYLKIQRKQKDLLAISRAISSLLDLAMVHGSQAAAARLLEEEKKQARLQAELELLQRRAAQQRIEVDEAVVAAKLSQMRNDLASFTLENVTPTQKFLRSFIDRIVISNEIGELYYHLPLFALPATSNRKVPPRDLDSAVCRTLTMAVYNKLRKPALPDGGIAQLAHQVRVAAPSSVLGG